MRNAWGVQIASKGRSFIERRLRLASPAMSVRGTRGDVGSKNDPREACYRGRQPMDPNRMDRSMQSFQREREMRV